MLFLNQYFVQKYKINSVEYHFCGIFNVIGSLIYNAKGMNNN